MRFKELKSVSIGHDQGVTEYSGYFIPFKEVDLTFSRLGPAHLDLTVALFAGIEMNDTGTKLLLSDSDAPISFTATSVADDDKTWRLFIPALSPSGTYEELHVHHRARKAEVTAKFEVECSVDEIRLETLSPASSALL